jgi:sec-independent protein translocase protein TatA
MLTAITFPASPALAFLEGIGAMEMMLVAVVGLLLFGGKGLPDMARTLGRVVREFKKASASVEQEVKRVMDEEPDTQPRPRPRPVRPVTLPAAASASAPPPDSASPAHARDLPPPPPPAGPAA